MTIRSLLATHSTGPMWLTLHGKQKYIVAYEDEKQKLLAKLTPIFSLLRPSELLFFFCVPLFPHQNRKANLNNTPDSLDHLPQLLKMRFTLAFGALCAMSVLAKPIPPSKNVVPSERSDDVGNKDPDFLKDHDIPKWVHDMAVHPEKWFDEVEPGEVEYYEGLVDKKRSEQAIQDASDVQAADAEEVVQEGQDISRVEKAEEKEGGVGVSNCLFSYTS